MSDKKQKTQVKTSGLQVKHVRFFQSINIDALAKNGLSYDVDGMKSYFMYWYPDQNVIRIKQNKGQDKYIPLANIQEFSLITPDRKQDDNKQGI